MPREWISHGLNGFNGFNPFNPWLIQNPNDRRLLTGSDVVSSVAILADELVQFRLGDPLVTFTVHGLRVRLRIVDSDLDLQVP